MAHVDVIDPDVRVALDDISDEEFDRHFAGAERLLVRRGKREVFAICSGTNKEIMDILDAMWSEGKFEGHEKAEFAIDYGPSELVKAFEELARLEVLEEKK